MQTIDELTTKLRNWELRTWRDYIPYAATSFFVVAGSFGTFLLGMRR